MCCLPDDELLRGCNHDVGDEDNDWGRWHWGLLQNSLQRSEHSVTLPCESCTIHNECLCSLIRYRKLGRTTPHFKGCLIANPRSFDIRHPQLKHSIEAYCSIRLVVSSGVNRVFHSRVQPIAMTFSRYVSKNQKPSSVNVSKSQYK